jgi:hypothetical protein
MIKVGDIVFAREVFMRDHPYYDSRKFIVVSFDGNTINLVNYKNDGQIYHGWYDPSHFFFFDDISLNKDIHEALERYEFQSFQGVTLEGKIIQLDLPNPSARKAIK